MDIRVALNGYISGLTWRLSQGVRSQELFAINLSSRFRWYLAPARAALGIAALVLGLMIVRTSLEAWRMHEEIALLQSAVDKVLAQDRQVIAAALKEGVGLSESSLQRLTSEIAFANQLIDKRSFSWTRFLTELEEAIPEKLSVISIRLEPGTSQVHLTGSAHSFEDVTAFMLGIERHPTFKHPVLGQHRDAGNGFVEFDLQLQYRGGDV